MHSILLICPYFGKLPSCQFPLWLESCKHNPTIDWLIITDDETPYDYPQNVRVNYTTWNSFKTRVESVFDFPIYFEKPYKVCDFRPAFGVIFEEEFKGYDFWGHTDCSDTIYGDIRSFLKEDILEKSDKVLLLGHFSLYRNTEELNQRYKLRTKSALTYKDIFTTEKAMFFDESKPHSINRIFKENHFAITDIPNFCLDITQKSMDFVRHVIADDWSHFYDPTGYKYGALWKEGKLYAIHRDGLRLCKEEVGYMHFQKRKMKGSISGSSYWIVPNSFVDEPRKLAVFRFIYYIEIRSFFRKVRYYLPFKTKKMVKRIIANT